MQLFFKKSSYNRFFLFLFFLILSGSLLLFSFSPQKNLSFQEMTEKLFLEDITTDTLSLHYTIAHPSHYGVSSYPVTLPKYSPETLHQSYSRIENILFNLSQIEHSSLSSEEAYCHKLLTDYLTLQKKGFPFTYFEEFFSPSNGIPANYPILMAEYTFRTDRDIKDYLALLKDTPNYFACYLQFQKERSEKGYHLATVSLQETLAQCDTLISKESLEKNSHFLQQTFRERISPLVAENIISKEEALRYIEENNQLLMTVVLPAYQELKHSLLSLQTEDVSLKGLSQYENGKKYYQWLVRKQTGCPLTIPEILDKLENDYKENLQEFLSLQQRLSTFGNYEEFIDKPFPLTDRNKILSILQSLASEDFPSLTSFSDRPIKTNIKSVSSCMEEYTSPAFYMIPPIDDFWQNTIYINTDSTPEGLELFTTLAHEGFPGHLYQTVYYQLYSKQNSTPHIRHLMNFSGYVEGWAIYSEFYSYSYATELYPKENQNLYSLWHQLLLCDRKLQLAILSILDIKLHYYDDSWETANDLLQEYGIADKETISNIHRYILEEPANYLTYYVGYLCFMDLKEKAKTLMGSDFTDFKFHQFVLDAGPSDFSSLEKKLTKALTP